MSHEQPDPSRSRRQTSRLSLLSVQQRLRGRFVSRGGRPSDPAPTVRRLVPIKKDVWRALQRHARLLSRIDSRVSPGQLAALLLEDTLRDLGFR